MQELNYLGAQIGKLSHRTSSLITFHPLVRVVKALVLFWFLLCIIQFHHLFLGFLKRPQEDFCPFLSRLIAQTAKDRLGKLVKRRHLSALLSLT